MTYDALPARLATVVAEYEKDTARWGECTNGNEHHAERRGPDHPVTGKHPAGVRRDWDGACRTCALPVPWGSNDLGGSSGNVAVYDTPSGRLEPGCLYLVDQHPGRSCGARWSNCTGQHLHGVLPSGGHWDIDSRAGNCGSPADTTHRCWVRHGEPPAVHVDKSGHTCSAGAGSIAATDYHGFLHHGQFSAG